MAQAPGSLRWIALVLGLVALYLVVDRIVFLTGAEIAEAEVLDLAARDGDCGRGMSQCTKFIVLVGWQAGDEERHGELEVGRASGYGVEFPASLAAVGDRIRLRYDPDEPDEYFRDEGKAIWRMPGLVALLAFVLGLAALFGDRKLGS